MAPMVAQRSVSSASLWNAFVCAIRLDIDYRQAMLQTELDHDLGGAGGPGGSFPDFSVRASGERHVTVYSR